VVVLKSYAQVGLPIVLHDGGRSTISSWGLQRECWCRKPADLEGQVSDSSSGLHCCCSGPHASGCTPFAVGVRRLTRLGASSSHGLRMCLGLHGRSRPCGRRESVRSPRGLTALMDVRTRDESRVPRLGAVPRAAKTPNFYTCCLAATSRSV
jgi:hypothetical protein